MVIREAYEFIQQRFYDDGRLTPASRSLANTHIIQQLRDITAKELFMDLVKTNLNAFKSQQINCSLAILILYAEYYPQTPGLSTLVAECLSGLTKLGLIFADTAHNCVVSILELSRIQTHEYMDLIIYRALATHRLDERFIHSTRCNTFEVGLEILAKEIKGQRYDEAASLLGVKAVYEYDDRGEGSK